MEELIKQLIDNGVLKSKAIIEALRAVDRRDFVPAILRDQAYDDTALSLGYGGTISQPTVVAFMLELLAPQPGEQVLDVGAGSGWTTALLAQLVGPTGRVVGLEIVPELVTFGQINLAKYHFPQARIKLTQTIVDWNERPAEFDKILVSAAAEAVPPPLLAQLKSPGILVMPINYDLWRAQKDKRGNLTSEKYPGFIFVPLQ